MSLDTLGRLLERFSASRPPHPVRVPFRLADIVKHAEVSTLTQTCPTGAEFHQELDLPGGVSVVLEGKQGELVGVARTERTDLVDSRVLISLTGRPADCEDVKSKEFKTAQSAFALTTDHSRAAHFSESPQETDDGDIPITGRIVLGPGSGGFAGTFSFGPVGDIARRIGRGFRWSAVLVPSQSAISPSMPAEDRRARRTTEAARAETSSGLSTQARPDVRDTLPFSPARTLTDSTIVTSMLNDAIEWTMYRLLTSPGREALMAGLDARSSSARHRLARAIAVQLWGTDQLPKERARVYWPAIGRAIRTLLLRWAEAQGDDFAVKSTPCIERANGQGSFIYPRMERPADWAAVSDLYEATLKDRPEVADFFELYTYAGLPPREIEKLIDVPACEIRFECKLLESSVFEEAV